mmetsp:Transcript_12701/g.40622  ORF Transcript_12701/g.40622 Transcript_12701/m.40622 type:complete len:347 (-) Transcript_12701:406-1446(-)
MHSAQLRAAAQARAPARAQRAAGEAGGERRSRREPPHVRTAGARWPRALPGLRLLALPDVEALEGGRVDGLAHGVQAHVDVERDPRDARHQVGEQAERGGAHVVGEQGLRQRGVADGVVDGALDEGLLPVAADGRGGAGLQRAGRDRVHPDPVLPARLPGQRAGVGLELRLGAAHATAVAGNDPLGRDVRQRNHGAARRHDGAEPGDHGDQRVGRRRGRRQVALAAGLQQGPRHLRAVGQRVHQDVDPAVVRLDLVGHLLDGEGPHARVPLVGPHVLGDVLRHIEGSIQGVDLRNLHQRPIIQLPCCLGGTLSEGHLEHLQHWRPSPDDDGSPCVCQLLCNGPAIT